MFSMPCSCLTFDIAGLFVSRPGAESADDRIAVEVSEEVADSFVDVEEFGFGKVSHDGRLRAVFDGRLQVVPDGVVEETSLGAAEQQKHWF